MYNICTNKRSNSVMISYLSLQMDIAGEQVISNTLNAYEHSIIYGRREYNNIIYNI